jgi:hypothetical protein
VGIGAQSLGIGSDTAWWWEAGPSAVVVLIGGSVAFAALLALLGCTFWVRRVPARTRKATATHTSAGEAPPVAAPGAAADPIAETSSHAFER